MHIEEKQRPPRCEEGNPRDAVQQRYWGNERLVLVDNLLPNINNYYLISPFPKDLASLWDYLTLAPGFADPNRDEFVF